MITASPLITPDLIESALTYEQYVQLATDLYAQGRSTSDDPHYNTPEILHYTKLNLQRMRRLDKTTVISDELAAAIRSLTDRYVWLVLTESWCGDAAQCVPVLHQIAALSPGIRFRLLLRDQRPDVMNAYLTNGGKSIPKLICLRAADLGEVGTWGARPAALQRWMVQWRAEAVPFAELLERVQRWYNDDRGQSLQTELLALGRAWAVR